MEWSLSRELQELPCIVPEEAAPLENGAWEGRGCRFSPKQKIIVQMGGRGRFVDHTEARKLIFRRIVLSLELS